MERRVIHETIASQYARLIELEPKLVTSYVPADAAEQKRLFLSSEIRNPNHIYDKLDDLCFEDRKQSLAEIGGQIISHPDLNPKYIAVYEEFIADYQAKTQLMECASLYNHATDTDEKARLRDEYMRLNTELYGLPDQTTYESLLQEKLQTIAAKNFTGEAAILREELFEMTSVKDIDRTPERFAPSAETMRWMHGVVENLYGGMLAHVPDQATFSEAEAQRVFESIIQDEFGEAAEGWKVDIERAKSINVKSTEKRIVIPDDRGEMTQQALRQLIVHEIGVHMLRSVMGGETDLEHLKNGLSGYYDAEEGLGKVMEQSLKGVFDEAGINHYITAGLSFLDGKDFRETFEAKWRLAVLSGLKENEEITEAAIVKAKNSAYGGTMRMFRGTDELPWFKDLSYYNGSIDMWRHLEAIRGDDTKFMFVLLGKANPASAVHEYSVYEAASI